MEFFLKVIWFSLPSIFLLLAVLQLLDMVSHGKSSKYFKIYISQFIFTLIAAIITYLVDGYFFPYEAFEGFLDKDFLKLTLFPIILLICSYFYGGSAPIKISKNLERYSYLNK